MAERRIRTLLVLAALFAPGLAPEPLRATTQATDGALELKSQTNWWLPDQPFFVELGVQTTAPEGLEVAVSIFRKIPNRTEFAATVEGRTVGRPVEQIPPVPLADLAVEGDGDRILTFIPSVRLTGVYPLRIQLRPLGSTGGNPVDTLTTYLVHVPSELEGEKLQVALILPAHAPPSVQPSGDMTIDDARAEQLAALAAALEAQPGAALSLAPTPETAEALAASQRDEDRATLAALSRSLERRQLLGGPYVPTNLTSVLQADLHEESAAQLARGTDALRSLFGREPSTEVRLVDERLTAEAIDFLQGEQSVRRLLVAEAFLEPVVQRTTLTNIFEMEGRRGRMSAAVIDDDLSAHFSGPDGPLAAQRLLADLAVIYNDDPPAERRGVAVAPPRGWEPSGEFVTSLLIGLDSSPILDGVTVGRFFDTVATATTGSGRRAVPMVRSIAPPPSGAAVAPSLPGTTIKRTRRRVDAFASALDATNPILGRLDRTILVSQSIELRTHQRMRYLKGAEEQVASEISKIEMPQHRSITLTAREGDLPVTITNTLGYPVRAVLRVVSDTLEFPDGAAQNLDLLRENTTSQFTVRAQSSGSFPLRVRLETPDGLLLAESRFTVRSTAISGVGTALSAGAGLFLLVWWGNHFRIRRSRRLVAAASEG